MEDALFCLFQIFPISFPTNPHNHSSFPASFSPFYLPVLAKRSLFAIGLQLFFFPSGSLSLGKLKPDAQLGTCRVLEGVPHFLLYLLTTLFFPSWKPPYPHFSYVLLFFPTSHKPTFYLLPFSTMFVIYLLHLCLNFFYKSYVYSTHQFDPHSNPSR